MDLSEYWTTADADPRAVYHDVLIALDEGRQINRPQIRVDNADGSNLSFEPADLIIASAGATHR